MRLQNSLTPRVKLLGKGLVQATDGTVDFEQPPAASGPLPLRMSGTGSSDKHLSELIARCGVRSAGSVPMPECGLGLLDLEVP
jgi:hypothetical protein